MGRDGGGKKGKGRGLGDVRTVNAIPSKWPIAEMAISAGSAFVPADSPKTFLNSEAAIVRFEERNSSRETPANCHH